jgi:O-acetyl-ADP-ribose deacetylase (regulator of RNase III)
MSHVVGTTTLEVVDASITTMEVDAIVNAANAHLGGGGGVDGAIHRAAGPALKAACLALPELRPAVRCEVGQVQVTPGFALPCRYVLHTVGPIWHGGDRGEPALLAACYRNALAEVARLGLASVAFPAISTGAYGYPADRAAAIAAAETVAFARRHAAPLRVVFACLGVAATRTLARALADAVR